MSNIINSRSNQIPYNIYVEQVVENLNNHLINCTIYYSLDMKCLKIYFERFDWDARIDTKILESSYYYEVPLLSGNGFRHLIIICYNNKQKHNRAIVGI